MADSTALRHSLPRSARPSHDRPNHRLRSKSLECHANGTHRCRRKCAKDLVQHDGGLTSMYKGHVVNTIQEAVFVANFFFIYERMRELLIHHQPTNGHHRRAEETTSTKTMILPLLAAFSPQLAIPVSRRRRHCRHDELGGEFVSGPACKVKPWWRVVVVVPKRMWTP
jgi:Mitochondrial carrier protein